jgi:glycine betaine/choline ABC-type transport system substrate-binding protein
MAFGKKAFLNVLRDPRRFFELYNEALTAKPQTLGHCPRFPDDIAKKALSSGEYRLKRKH